MNKLKKILLIDEQQFFSENLKKIIADSGNFEIETALNISAATENLSKNKFDFILIDTRIMTYWGAEIEKALLPNNYEAKVIMLESSAFVNSNSFENNNFITIEKPFEINELLKVLTKNGVTI
ncbi:MAG: response regulator [Stygiobacter sp.]